MRIAVWHNLPSGGGKRALFGHVQGLIERGHHVEAWRPPAFDEGYLPLSEILLEHVVDLRQTKRQTVSERLQLDLHISRAIGAMDDHCRKCAQQIAEKGFDVLFANACSLYRTTSIGRFCNLPSVIYLGEPYRWLYEAMPMNSWAAQTKSSAPFLQRLRASFVDLRRIRHDRVQVREEIANAAAFDKILCNSLYSKEYILKAYGLRPEVCYLGIDTRLFRISENESRHFIGLGAIVREKNVEFAIRAVSSVQDGQRKLVWVGNVADMAYLEEMKALAADLHVAFEPLVRISDEQLLKLMSQAEAMIYAPHLEPFGLAPLEAAACGVPVVAVPEGGIRETVIHERTGLLAESPLAAGQALMRLREDEELRTKICQQAKAAVGGFWSRESGTDRIVSALSSVVTGQNRAS